MTDLKYTCDLCHETFIKGWSDEEAKAEADELWTAEEQSREGMAVICEDCFQRFMAQPLAGLTGGSR